MENILLNMPKTQKPVILGTDWHSDCDDAAAIRILAWAHINKVVRLLGISIDSAMEYSVSSMLTFMRHEGIEDVSLGFDRNAVEYGGKTKYQPRLAAGRDIASENLSCEDALRLYRRLLAFSEDKVDIIEIGFSQVISELLSSGADEFSPLSGIDLVRSKVGKLWIMGGNWQDGTKKECNFTKAPKATYSINKIMELCPVEIVFLGFEVGCDVISGRYLSRHKKDMLYGIFSDYGFGDGRASWDPLTAYLACTGNINAAGYRQVRGWASIDTTTGFTDFVEDENGKHSYVVKLKENEEYADCLDEIMTLHYEYIFRNI